MFGFGDGINTSLGIAAGVGGADVASNFIILAALIGMFTGAKAMAVQNYLAVKSHRELLKSEIAREEYEIEQDWVKEIWEQINPGMKLLRHYLNGHGKHQSGGIHLDLSLIHI